ncbi:MAG: DUF1802 family protein [Verrucomicrobiota bacterium]
MNAKSENSSILIEPIGKPIAFKEWAVVVEAIQRGEQSVLLRKGGISEGRLGFEWQGSSFFLFPTQFHVQPEKVKPTDDGNVREWEVPPIHSETISFSVFIQPLASGRLVDWESVAKLDPFHIWTEETIRERYEWGDEPGISWSVVRAFVLPKAWKLHDRKSFGGCRSWISLPEDEGGEWRTLVQGAEEVSMPCGLPDWLLEKA